MAFDCIEEIQDDRYHTLEEVEKFNPYHDERGRFTSGGSGGGLGVSLGYGGKVSFESSREKVSGTLRDVEKRNMDLDHEVATVIDPNSGKALFQIEGKGTHVEFNRSEILEMRGKVLTHNHPEAAIFSPADMATAYHVSAIRATTRDGTVYELSGMNRKDAVLAYRDQYITARNNALKKMGVAENTPDSHLTAAQREVNFAAVTHAMDQWLTANANAYGFKYQKGAIEE